MKPRDEDVRKLEKALISAHRSHKEIHPGSNWQRDVMMHIRRLRPQKDAAPYTYGDYGTLVWRVAACASLVALVLMIYSIRMDLNAEFELARMCIDDSTGLYFARSFGVL